MSDDTTRPFVPIEGQSFSSEQDWINRATRRLTSHPEYRNTEHGEQKGWRGHHFTALCFDQAGNRMRQGGDFMRATKEGTYPVWWIWPDQINDAVRGAALEKGLDPCTTDPDVHAAPTWPHHRMRIDLSGVCHTTNDMLNGVEHPLRGKHDAEDMASHSAFFDQLLIHIAAVKEGKASLADFADFYCITPPTGADADA